jgi:hypothetical protein
MGWKPGSNLDEVESYIFTTIVTTQEMMHCLFLGLNARAAPLFLNFYSADGEIHHFSPCQSNCKLRKPGNLVPAYEISRVTK